MTVSAEANGALIKPPSKRSLFNKPSWSKPQPTGSAVDMFSRSHDTYTDIVAEEKRERLERLARKELKKASLPAIDDSRQAKRRRTSRQSGKEDGSSSEGEDAGIKEGFARSLEAGGQLWNETTTTPEKVQKEISTYSTTEGCDYSVLTENIKPISTHTAVVDLEDEDDDEPDGALTSTDAKTPPHLSEDDLPASDEEFPDIAQKARERARLKAAASHQNPEISAEPIATMRTKQQSAIEQPCEVIRTPPPDPTVKILITSTISNTKPLIVHRLLSQRLKDVKYTWCERQGFSEDIYDSIHLTWRGHKLFNVTTCKSLGIGVDEYDNLVIRGDRSQTALSDDDGRIHMEAMTDDMIQAQQKVRDTKVEVENEDFSLTQFPVKQTKITLKSKGCSPFKLLVKASTPISRIVKVWRQQNHVPADYLVFLMFDGDRLETDSCVRDTELGDLDVVEVHVRGGPNSGNPS